MEWGGEGGWGGGDAHLRVFSSPTKSLFFSSEQSNMRTFSWYTSAYAEARLFSSYKALKVGMTLICNLLTTLALFICVVGLQCRWTEQCLK